MKRLKLFEDATTIKPKEGVLFEIPKGFRVFDNNFPAGQYLIWKNLYGSWLAQNMKQRITVSFNDGEWDKFIQEGKFIVNIKSKYENLSNYTRPIESSLIEVNGKLWEVKASQDGYSTSFKVMLNPGDEKKKEVLDLLRKEFVRNFPRGNFEISLTWVSTPRKFPKDKF